MFTIGLILALLGYFVFHSMVITIIGVVLLFLGLGGNGYAHFGSREPGVRPRYWF